MFVSASALVPGAVEQVRAAFAQPDLAALLLADEAEPPVSPAADGATSLIPLRIGPARALSKPAALVLAAPREVDGEITVPICWFAVGVAPALFPRMDANLRLLAQDGGGTELALAGRYDPPLGLVGRTLDRVALHRLAEATVRQLLDRIAVVVTGLIGPTAAGTTAPAA